MDAKPEVLGGPVVQHGNGCSPGRQLDPPLVPLEVVLHGLGDAEGGVGGGSEEGLDGLREADERVAAAEGEGEDRVAVVVPVDDEARPRRLQERSDVSNHGAELKALPSTSHMKPGGNSK